MDLQQIVDASSLIKVNTNNVFIYYIAFRLNFVVEANSTVIINQTINQHINQSINQGIPPLVGEWKSSGERSPKRAGI